MSEELLRRQLQRQEVLQPVLVLPGGRVVSIEEGRSIAKGHIQSVRADEAEGPEETFVVLEPEVSKRVVLTRQSLHSGQNVKNAVVRIRQEQSQRRVVAENANQARRAAAKILCRDASSFEAVRKDRRRRDLGKVQRKAKDR
jgi:ABC-type uncharacterized transport system ATPase subunit